MHPRIALEAAVTVFLMGLVPIIIRHTTANAWTIGYARLGIGAVGLGAILLLTGRRMRPERSAWPWLAAIGLLFGVHWALYFASVKVSSAAVAVIGQSTFGIHLVVLGWVIGHHQVRRLDLVAIALAVLGSLLVSPRWSFEDRATLGLAFGLVSAFSYAFLPILHQRLAHLPSSVRAFWQFVFALPVFAPFLPRVDLRLPAADWGWLLLLGVVCTVFQHTLWTRLTTRLSTLTTSLLFYMAVPVALVLAVTVLGERVTGRMLTGAALIVTGNVLGVLDQWRAGRLMFVPPRTAKGTVTVD